MSDDLAWAIRTFALVISVLLIAVIFAMSTGAFGHGIASWIMEKGYVDPVSGLDCCGEKDCKPLPGDQVKITPGGYFIVPTGETIPESRALPSKDGQFWRCTVLGVDGNVTRCFFRGIPGS